jgi:hypothetical protein
VQDIISHHYAWHAVAQSAAFGQYDRALALYRFVEPLISDAIVSSLLKADLLLVAGKRADALRVQEQVRAVAALQQKSELHDALCRYSVFVEGLR